MIRRRGTLCTCRVLEQDVQNVVTRSSATTASEAAIASTCRGVSGAAPGPGLASLGRPLAPWASGGAESDAGASREKSDAPRRPP